MSNSTLSRRQLAVGAAWAVPTVAIASPTPAFAASPPPPSTYASICSISYGDGSATNQNMSLSFGFCTPTRRLTKGTVLTYRVASDKTLALPQLPSSTTTLGYSQARIDPNTIEFKVTLLQDWTLTNDCYCPTYASNTMKIRWMAPDMPLQQQSTLTISSTFNGGAPGSLKFKVAKRHFSTPGDPSNPSVGHVYYSKSGAQQCYPQIAYTYLSRSKVSDWACGDGSNDTTTWYPDGSCRIAPDADNQTNVISAVC